MSSSKELDHLIDSLRRQRGQLETQIASNGGERAAADLVEKLQQLRKRAEDIDDTWRNVQSRNTR